LRTKPAAIVKRHKRLAFLAPLTVFLWCLIFTTCPSAQAQTTTYTYTGSNINRNVFGFSCPFPNCPAITGSFTVSQPLPANLGTLQANGLFNPVPAPSLLTYSFTFSGVTINDSNCPSSSNTCLVDVRTDSSGALDGWYIYLETSACPRQLITVSASPEGYGDQFAYNAVFLGCDGTGAYGGQSVINGTWVGGGASSCQNTINNSVTPSVSLPGSSKFITATFMPQPAGSVTLAQAENICGYTNFDWQQTITTYPVPSVLVAVQPSPACLGPLNVCVAPPPFLDPPAGGYVYELTQGYPDGDHSFPFYYDAITNGGEDLLAHETDDTLTFYDLASDPCLPTPSGLPSVSNSACGNAMAPKGSRLVFTTHLVGICGTAPGCTSSFVAGTTTNCITLGSCVDLKVGFNWISTFNGTSGGAATTKNSLPVDPGSGTGGITITSINSVPGIPPNDTCTATPSSLWPPNGQSVFVTVSGSITAGTSALTANRYAVIDEYGQDQPNGGITLGAGGSYSLAVPLIAARNGNDKDGRTYTINVTSSDKIGNVGACSTVVTVPHDQGQ
jgi:hypothetical protein